MDEYPMPEWAIYQITRPSGLVEDICEHYVGHPNIHWLKKHDPCNVFRFSVHGCCGCCNEKTKIET